MSEISLTEQTAAATPTPAAGKINIFIDSVTGTPYYKNSAGVASPLGGGGGMTLVASTTLGAAGPSITVAGLDLATHKKYQVRVKLKNNTASAAYVNLYYNGDTVLTNYWSQIARFNHTTFAGARSNNPYITLSPASSIVEGDISLTLDLDGKAGGLSTMRTGNDSAIESEIYAHARTVVGNVTSISLACANDFAIGSVVEVWKY